MKFYFSTHRIPALKGLPLAERMTRLQQAQAKLSVPERLVLNLLKLAVLVPVFVFILQSAQNWSALLWAALAALTYPIILKPLQHSMCVKYLKEQSHG